MPSADLNAGRAPDRRPSGPSMLDLIRLSPAPVFPPGGQELYRQIVRLADLQAGQEVLDAACGRGVTTSFLVSSTGADGVGIDPDRVLIEEAEARAREAGLEGRLHFQDAALGDLPYRDGVFDLVIGEIGLAAEVDPARAVRELARVVKPRGSVVLVQLVWTGNLGPERREELVRHLGARPMLLVEWKQLLRDAGVVDLHVEDWSDESSPFRPGGGDPFPDFARIFTLRQKGAILRRAWRRWGWRGLRSALLREQEVHRMLTHQRLIGLTLIKGTRWE